MPRFRVTIKEKSLRQAEIEVEADDWEQAEAKAADTGATYWEELTNDTTYEAEEIEE